MSLVEKDDTQHAKSTFKPLIIYHLKQNLPKFVHIFNHKRFRDFFNNENCISFYLLAL